MNKTLRRYAEEVARLTLKEEDITIFKLELIMESLKKMYKLARARGYDNGRTYIARKQRKEWIKSWPKQFNSNAWK